MFIKFSDKTKKIIVKDSKDNDDNQSENTLSLDEEDEDNRRIKTLRSYKTESEKERSE